MNDNDLAGEQQRHKDFSFYISPTYDYSPTFEDFRDEEAFIKRKRHLTITYLYWLRETKKIYGNARHYYTVWGARGGQVDMGGTYDKILAFIQEEIKICKAKINKQSVAIKSPEPLPTENNTSIKQVQKKIDEYFNKLELFIQKIPISEKGRNYIWFDSFIRFYDHPAITEDGSFTIGIQTEWQLQQFIEQFKKNFQKLRIRRMEDYSKELNELPGQKAIEKIDKELHRIKQKEILAEIGGIVPNDWDKFLKKYLSNEKEYHAKPKYKEVPVFVEKNNSSLKTESISDYLYNLPESNQNELDIYNYIEKVTDGFNAVKLKILLKEVEIVIHTLFDEKEPDNEEQKLRVEEWKKKNKEIPFKTLPPLLGKLGKTTEEIKDIDIHKLFPEIDIELFPLYQFRNYVTTLINQGMHNTPPKVKPLIDTGESTSKSEEKISLPAIALMYRYLQLTGEHDGITHKNRNEIALKYKWSSKSSGRKLDSYYKGFHSESDRISPTILKDEAGYYQSRNKRIAHIRQAVQELTSYPKSLELAQKELEKACK